MLDLAIFLNINDPFKDNKWIDLYNRTVKLYGTCNSDEHPAQFQFDRLKTDQALPVFIFDLINKGGYQYGM